MFSVTQFKTQSEWGADPFKVCSVFMPCWQRWPCHTTMLGTRDISLFIWVLGGRTSCHDHRAMSQLIAITCGFTARSHSTTIGR